jgi:hypothetical protein
VSTPIPPPALLLDSREGATIAEWRPRSVEEVRRLQLGLTEAAEHELVGPAQALGWDAFSFSAIPGGPYPRAKELERHGVRAAHSELVLDWLRPAALASRLAPEVEKARADPARASSPRR